MNTPLCACGWGSPRNWPGTGRKPRFLNDAHRMAFSRANKLKSASSLPSKEPTQTLPPEPDNYSHLDANHFLSHPHHIAPYRPIRNDLHIAQLEAGSFKSDAHCAF
jgi:hypothetical protein